MDKRLVSFMFLTAAILFGHMALTQWLFPPPPRPVVEEQAEQPAEQPAEVKRPDDAAAVIRPAIVKANDEEPAMVEPRQWPTLGSLDENGDYRMLVTFTNQGAAVVRAELNNPRYHAVDNLHPLGGYLGSLEAETFLVGGLGPQGCKINVVGPGTPAHAAGLQPGDVITAVAGVPTPDVGTFALAMRRTKPATTVKLSFARGGVPDEREVSLRRHPLSVVKPEYSDPANPDDHDPLSFLMTINEAGGGSLGVDDEELPGFDLRTANWEVTDAGDGGDAPGPDEVVFRRTLPAQNIEVVKRFKLEPREKRETAQPYTLGLTIEVRNTAADARKIAYRLDGPTGLPMEGYWYAKDSKIGLEGGCGMRDIVYGVFKGDYVSHGMMTCTAIVDKEATHLTEDPISYVGVDSQYFAGIVKPELANPSEKRFARVSPLNVDRTPPPEALKRQTDIGFRMISSPTEVTPGTPLTHEFKVFLGPKVPAMLATVGAEDQIDYGWYDWIAVPMVTLLHFFYGLVRNYGLAIVMLTICVRLLLFPLSKKQALHSIKMQELQPELRKINEKYKGQREQLAKAQQELFRKHNCNPFSGCLPILIQLPIFVALYNSLKVDVELRQAPLISESFRWASDLSAPDMFWHWERFMPAFFGGEDGWLGPFLNLLPLVTIVLFLIQQKMFMPPPTDEQQALQQKMMKYMMIFMAVMFFKVPAGLCVYFIASSLWSIGERKILPKPPTPAMSKSTLNVEAAKPERRPVENNGKRQKRRR